MAAWAKDASRILEHREAGSAKVEVGDAEVVQKNAVLVHLSSLLDSGEEANARLQQVHRSTKRLRLG